MRARKTQTVTAKQMTLMDVARGVHEVSRRSVDLIYMSDGSARVEYCSRSLVPWLLDVVRVGYYEKAAAVSTNPWVLLRHAIGQAVDSDEVHDRLCSTCSSDSTSTGARPQRVGPDDL